MMPDRVGEVDDPGVRLGTLAHLLGDPENDGNRAQCLGKAARPGRLLPDQTELVGQRLVDQAGLLTADAQLDEHGRRTVDSRGQVAVSVSRPAKPCRSRMRWARPPDDAQSLG